MKLPKWAITFFLAMNILGVIICIKGLKGDY